MFYKLKSHLTYNFVLSTTQTYPIRPVRLVFTRTHRQRNVFALEVVFTVKAHFRRTCAKKRPTNERSTVKGFPDGLHFKWFRKSFPFISQAMLGMYIRLGQKRMGGGVCESLARHNTGKYHKQVNSRCAAAPEAGWHSQIVSRQQPAAHTCNFSRSLYILGRFSVWPQPAQTGALQISLMLLQLRISFGFVSRSFALFCNRSSAGVCQFASEAYISPSMGCKEPSPLHHPLLAGRWLWHTIATRTTLHAVPLSAAASFKICLSESTGRSFFVVAGIALLDMDEASGHAMLTIA